MPTFSWVRLTVMVNTSAQVSLSTGVADVLRTVEKVGKSKRSAHTSAIDVKKLKMVFKKSRIFKHHLNICGSCTSMSWPWQR